MTHGTYETVDGRPAVRLERRLAHPIDVVWRAVTEPSELAHWFPAQVTIDLREGGAIAFAPDTRGEVLALDPPRRLAFTWEQDELRFELEEEDGGAGCRFVLTHLLAERDAAARNAAGWQVCVDRLSRGLDGEATPEPTDEWEAHYAAYVRAGFPEGAPVPGRD